MRLSLSPGSEPNPHALAAFSKAGGRFALVAAQDIVDFGGATLWARDQPVTAALHARLLGRRLRQPLEACLRAEQGVTPITLMHDLQELIDADTHPLAPALRPWAATLVAQLRQIPLHPVAQLLLTTAAATRPATLAHAVAGMALAGAMVASRDASQHEVRLAMLGGLLHDIGELYINPTYLDYTQSLGVVGHKHLVAHPRLGQVLLCGLTDYPAALGQAVAEHHERLDRSGYPGRLDGDEISTLGRVLAVMEVTLGSLCALNAPLTRASFALRVVPGEFDPVWVAFICDAAQASAERFEGDAAPQAAPLEAQIADIDRHLSEAQQLAAALDEQRRVSQITEVVSNALQRLERVRGAWSALGQWGSLTGGSPPSERLELELAECELRQRLRGFHRECLLASERLSEAEKLQLAPLWERLTDSHG